MIHITQQKPRIPFGSLIEGGVLKPGALLFNKARQYQAKIRIDGSIKAPIGEGSIHKVGALAQGAKSCNGLDFLAYQTRR